MKKVLSMLLVLAMLLSLPTFSGFAEEEAVSSAHEFVVVQPGSMPTITSRAQVSMDEEITFNDASTLKYTTTGATNNQLVMPVAADFGQYDTVHIALYSPKATDDNIGIMLRHSHYSEKAIKVDWEGWKIIDIPYSEFNSLDENEIKVIKAVEIWDQGWSFNYGDTQKNSDQNGSINIGKIWFTDSSRVDVFDGNQTIRLSTNKNWKVGVAENYVYNELPGYLVLKLESKYEYPVKYHALLHVRDGETGEYRKNTYYSNLNRNLCYGDTCVVIAKSELSDYGNEPAKETDILHDFEIYFHGWGYEDYDSADVITVNSIYFTNNPPSEKEAGAVIFEGYTQKAYGSTAIDSQNTCFGLPTNKWTFSHNSNFEFASPITDISGYDTLNVMLYSEKSVSDTVGIRINDGTALHGGKDIVVDWTGWKKVEIPLSVYTGLNKSNITKFYFANAGWNYGWGDPSHTDKIGNLSFMNIGKAWLSTEKTGFETYLDIEFNYGWYQKTNVDLTAKKGFTFDVYNPTYAPDKYVAYIIRDVDNGNAYVQSGGIHLDFTGWRTMTIPLQDKAKIKNANFYLSGGWGLAGVSGTAAGDEHGAKARKLKMADFDFITEKAIEPTIAKTSGFDYEMPYVKVGIENIKSVKAYVAEKESGEIVDYTPVFGNGAIGFDFEKEPGKTYTINVGEIIDTHYTKYPCTYSFDYAVNTLTEGFVVEAKDVVVSEANVKAYFDYVNLSGDIKKATVVIAVYDALGTKLEGMRIIKYDQLHSGRVGELYAELGGNYMSKTVKAFALDSLETLKPLCEVN